MGVELRARLDDEAAGRNLRQVSARHRDQERLIALLKDWRATLRGAPPDLPWVLDDKRLSINPVLTLQTRHGRFDVMDRIDGIGDYAACLARSVETVYEGVRLRVLDLNALIESKRATRAPGTSVPPSSSRRCGSGSAGAGRSESRGDVRDRLDEVVGPDPGARYGAGTEVGSGIGCLRWRRSWNHIRITTSSSLSSTDTSGSHAERGQTFQRTRYETPNDPMKLTIVPRASLSGCVAGS